MAHASDEEKQILLDAERELCLDTQALYPAASRRADRQREAERERARVACPLLPVTIFVGTEDDAEIAVQFDRLRLEAVIRAWAEGRCDTAAVARARKTLTLSYARRTLATQRAALEREGVNWAELTEDNPADDDDLLIG